MGKHDAPEPRPTTALQPGDVSYEDAARCPKCFKPGEKTAQRHVPRQLTANRMPAMLHTLTCRNSVCPWYDTSWFIQVNDDGSIPKEETNRTEEKIYPNRGASPARKEQALARLRRQLHDETGGKM
jgi:hypothetical protein